MFLDLHFTDQTLATLDPYTVIRKVWTLDFYLTLPSPPWRLLMHVQLHTLASDAQNSALQSMRDRPLTMSHTLKY